MRVPASDRAGAQSGRQVSPTPLLPLLHLLLSVLSASLENHKGMWESFQIVFLMIYILE